MKKILVIHTKYRNKGGEDIAVENEVALLKKNFVIEELYFTNNIESYLQQAVSFIFNKNRKSVNLLTDTIKNFNPDYAYVHNTWFKASLGIFNILEKNNIKILLKLHNFRYDCTKSLTSRKHLKGKDFCDACGMKKKSTNWFNMYFSDSLLKSLLILSYGRKYFNILKDKNIKILVLTNFHKEYLSELLDQQKNIFVLPNFIEVTHKTKPKNDEEYIIYAGRISKEKGVEELIKSFLDSSLVGIKLKIVGDGPELSEFKKKYENENVNFLGELDNKDVLKLISNSKAVVTATKLYEGQPTLLCEASSMGVVSIFPRTGGISEFFPDKYPLAFKQFDYRDLTQKLSSLQNYKNQESIGNSNMEFIEKYLSKELLIEKFKELTNEK